MLFMTFRLRGAKTDLSRAAPVLGACVGIYCHEPVCAVFIGMRDVGLEQIRAGMAWWYREYAHEQTTQQRLVYRDEEEAAKAARRGLWTDPKAMPPWAWRKTERP